MRAELRQGGGDLLAGERLLRSEEAAARDQVHVGTEPGVRRRHLSAHRAAAEDRQRHRHPLHARRVAARPRLALAKTGDVGEQRRRPRAHRHRVPGREDGDRSVVGGHGDLLGRGDRGPAAHQVDPGSAEPLDLAVVLPVAGHVVAPPQHGGDVEGAGHGLPCAADPLRRAQCRRGAQQRLGGDARPVGALAPDELGLHDHGAQTALRGPVGDVLTDRSRSDDDDVVLDCGHVSLLSFRDVGVRV